MNKIKRYVDMPEGSKVEMEAKKMSGLGRSLYLDGVSQGESRLSALLLWLFANGRNRDVQDAVNNESVRERLYQEYDAALKQDNRSGN